MMEPKDLRPGEPVWYASSPGILWPAVVDGEPWKLGGHTWVVRLRDLPPEYGAQFSFPRTTVCAAALFALTPRVE